jgi:drug/metabolite transporter (DMT)-like permease
MALGIVGIVVLLGLDVRGAQFGAIAAIALVVIGYGTAPLVVSRALPDVPGVAASSIALTVTALVYAPFAGPRLGRIGSASPSALWAVLALGVVCTAVALAIFFALIREAGPQRALVITFVNPAVAVLLGVLLLGEPFTIGLAVGLPLILAGCVLATRRSAPAVADRDAEVVDAPVP